VRPRTGRAERGSFLASGLRSAKNAPKDGVGSTPSEDKEAPSMKVRGGEFDRLQMGTFSKPEIGQFALALLRRFCAVVLG